MYKLFTLYTIFFIFFLYYTYLTKKYYIYINYFIILIIVYWKKMDNGGKRYFVFRGKWLRPKIHYNLINTILAKSSYLLGMCVLYFISDIKY